VPYKINPSLRVIYENGLSIEADTAVGRFQSALGASDELDRIYDLISLMSFHEFDRDTHPEVIDIFDDLLSGGIIIECSEVLNTIRPSAALLLSSYPQMIAHALQQPIVERFPVSIIDNLFIDDVQDSLDIFVRRLAYSRVDLDREDVFDLHSVHLLSPPNLHVRAQPFLRCIDSVLRNANLISDAQTPLRAHVYSGVCADVYHPHMDSKDSGDVTTVYYPSTWCDTWGGELLFSDAGEARWVVPIKKGRLVTFKGSVPHRIGCISALASHPRYSVVVRYGIPVAVE
jgi:Rps23 Pro-64 3,4-dihydroxylase Tpa1-like proline 4-hydroxylase